MCPPGFELGALFVGDHVGCGDVELLGPPGGVVAFAYDHSGDAVGCDDCAAGQCGEFVVHGLAGAGVQRRTERAIIGEAPVRGRAMRRTS